MSSVARESRKQAARPSRCRTCSAAIAGPTGTPLKGSRRISDSRRSGLRWSFASGRSGSPERCSRAPCRRRVCWPTESPVRGCGKDCRSAVAGSPKPFGQPACCCFCPKSCHTCRRSSGPRAIRRCRRTWDDPCGRRPESRRGRGFPWTAPAATRRSRVRLHIIPWTWRGWCSAGAGTAGTTTRPRTPGWPMSMRAAVLPLLGATDGHDDVRACARSQPSCD